MRFLSAELCCIAAGCSPAKRKRQKKKIEKISLENERKWEKTEIKLKKNIEEDELRQKHEKINERNMSKHLEAVKLSLCVFFTNDGAKYDNGKCCHKSSK